MFATFNQETIAGSGLLQEFTYYGHIHQILGIGFQYFDLHIFDVEWFQVEKGGLCPSIKVALNSFVIMDSKRL